MAENKTQGVAYGSLYYNVGERLDKAKEQIVKVSKDMPIGWFFDVIHTKNQTPTMEGLKLQIIGIIKEQNPKMVDDNIIVITSVYKKRPVRPAQKLMLDLFQMVNSKKKKEEKS